VPLFPYRVTLDHVGRQQFEGMAVNFHSEPPTPPQIAERSGCLPLSP
jgi:hypothetical protein